jgi:hypothetical protein
MVSQTPSQDPLLAEFKFQRRVFSGTKEVVGSFESDAFQKLNQYQRADAVNQALVHLLKDHADRGFLLFELLDFIHRIHEGKFLDRYSISDIELWLNQFSLLSSEENYFYRGLITGRWIPRDDYQTFFPIGMGKVHSGSHFVTAHQSPDIDTIVSSFWGWMDAFAARVSAGLHIWNVPGGPPASSVEVKLLFHDPLHAHVFQYLSKNRGQLAVTSFDLMTQKGFVRKKRFEPSLGLDSARNTPAVVLVDDEGYYLGDWRPFDVESIRQVIMLLQLCLRWFESTIHIMLFSVFARTDLSREHLPQFAQEIAALSIAECDPLQEMTLRQQQLLNGFLTQVLGVKSGIQCNFSEVVAAVDVLEVADFEVLWHHITALEHSELFNAAGKIVENRPLIFFYLEKIVKDLNEVFRAFRLYIDTLDVAFKIKTGVFGYLPQYLSYRTDVKEIEHQMGSYPYLTVNIPGPGDKQIPVGVINAVDLKQKFLGTATLRDFCNREETQIPSYLEVISVIDHHKTSLNTNMPPTAFIADAQSANSLVAHMAFTLHDEYSLSGMSAEAINKQIKELQGKASIPSDYRILRRLYKKQEILAKKQSFYVDPVREHLEYIQYVFAILDDTDLLTKVSKRDVLTVAELINRLKTLMLKKETEVIHFDDVPHDESFVKQAAMKLLQNHDLYSLYQVSSEEKEKVIAENFLKCSKGETSDVFLDTKTQNGCCRVGQTKVFAKNYPLFDQNRLQIREYWYHQALAVYARDPEIDLHMHMISTIACAEELFQGKLYQYYHPDQMWIWVPATEIAAEHLKLFLSTFSRSPSMVNNPIQLEFYGARARELAALFKESFGKAEHRFSSESVQDSYAVMYYNAGSLNSRKAMVSPYLPKLAKA